MEGDIEYIYHWASVLVWSRFLFDHYLFLWNHLLDTSLKSYPDVRNCLSAVLHINGPVSSCECRPCARTAISRLQSAFDILHAPVYRIYGQLQVVADDASVLPGELWTPASRALTH